MAFSKRPTLDANSRRLPQVFRMVALAMFAATGMLLRQVAIPTSLPYVTLTPGFTVPLLAGIVLGPIEGLVCGFFVGISGGFSEPVLLPVLGNVALGLSTGIPSLARRRLPFLPWASVCAMSGSFFGGFLPTFSVEVLVFLVQPVAACLAALADGVQGFAWAIVALVLDQAAVQPLLLRFIDQREGNRGKATGQVFERSSNLVQGPTYWSKD